MNYIVKPSLEHIALVTIGVALWNQNDVRFLLRKFNFSLVSSEKIKEWQKIENDVTERVLQLPLPEISKQKIIAFIKPIGLEILKWVEYHCTKYIHAKLLPNLCWNSFGTIDRKKTVELLIKWSNLDICERYKLACVYCLEHEISELWNKIPEIDRRSFSSRLPQRSTGSGFPKICIEENQQDLVSFWTYIKQNGWYEAFCSYQYLFECCAITGNKAATEYFFEKLNVTETDDFLVRYARFEADADVLCLLLPLMDKEHQTEVFKSVPHKVLRVFLEWPFQNSFIEIANFMWNFLSKEDYDRLLNTIVDKIRDGSQICNYKKIFVKFLQQSPSSLKSCIIGERANGILLTNLYLNKDKESFKLLLRSISVKEKKVLIYSDKMRHICQYLIFKGEWDLLGFLIEECLLSENEMMQFKEDFERHVTTNFSKEHFSRKKDKWDQIFFLLNHSAVK